ncbi:MAG: Hpt domain-containing protein [Phycisphaeraceae bacterium]|nr:Hpt domain-containing protein [Phycisphaeraceae bacterium]
MSHSVQDQNQNPSPGPLVSTLANDPDMVELVQFFVDEIDDRITTIQTASQADDIAGLRTVAHQLKGAATGYGFEPISQTAGELERLIDATDALEVTSAIQQQVDHLIELCRRVAA